jgi:hypothetical protein
VCDGCRCQIGSYTADAEWFGNLSLHRPGAAAMVTMHLPIDVDFIEELKLRRWARENYVSAERRDSGWHPIVLEEMTRKDREAREAALAS